MKQAILLLCVLLLCPCLARAQTPAASPALTNNVVTTQTPAPVNAAVSAPPVATKGGGGSVVLPAEKRAPVRIPRFDKPPVIDGKLDETVWQQGALFNDFYQTSPGYNTQASVATEVRMGYDARNLYIAFHCYDEPGKVRATIAKRDDVFADDTIRVLLDTYNDQRKAYVLTFNPLGVQQDGSLAGRLRDRSGHSVQVSALCGGQR
jgi:hypothetical protein